MENIDDTGKALNWFEKLLELARKYKWFEWLEVFIIIIITATIITVFSKPAKVIDYFQKAATEQHNELLMKRQEKSIEIQSICDKLLYKLKADRVVVLELHNSISNVNGLPFLKASATTESINDGIYPIANQYQNTNLSLIPFANYLYSNGYWFGDTMDMKELDKGLCYKMLSNDTNHFFAGIIPSKESSVGFIFVSYCGDNRPENENELKFETQKAAMSIGVLLELKKNI